MKNCGCESFRAEGGFKDFPDYEDCKRNAVSSDIFSPVVVSRKYAGAGGLDEFWFKCNICERVWRLVEPDPPFKGMWSQV